MGQSHEHFPVAAKFVVQPRLLILFGGEQTPARRHERNCLAQSRWEWISPGGQNLVRYIDGRSRSGGGEFYNVAVWFAFVRTTERKNAPFMRHQRTAGWAFVFPFVEHRGTCGTTAGGIKPDEPGPE